MKKMSTVELQIAERARKVKGEALLRRDKSVRWGFNGEHLIYNETPLSFPAGNQSCPVRISHPPETYFA